MPTDDKKLSPLEKQKAKLAQLQARVKDMEARQAAQDRKDDTRRKVIAGALALEHLEKNPEDPFSKKLFRLLDEYARPNERRLFEHLGITHNTPQEPANDDGSLKAEFKKT